MIIEDKSKVNANKHLLFFRYNYFNAMK